MYRVRQFALAAARANAMIPVAGLSIVAWTDGTLNGVSVRLDDASADAIPLDQFAPATVPFHRLYLTHQAQEGKTLSLWIGQVPGLTVSPGRIGAAETDKARGLWPDAKVGRLEATAEDPQTDYATVLSYTIGDGLIFQAEQLILESDTPDKVEWDFILKAPGLSDSTRYADKKFQSQKVLRFGPNQFAAGAQIKVEARETGGGAFIADAILTGSLTTVAS